MTRGKGSQVYNSHKLRMSPNNQLADCCEKIAIQKIGDYVTDRENRSAYSGIDRLDDAQKLLTIAAALRARQS